MLVADMIIFRFISCKFVQQIISSYVPYELQLNIDSILVGILHDIVKNFNICLRVGLFVCICTSVAYYYNGPIETFSLKVYASSQHFRQHIGLRYTFMVGLLHAQTKLILNAKIPTELQTFHPMYAIHFPHSVFIVQYRSVWGNSLISYSVPCTHTFGRLRLTIQTQFPVFNI